MRTRNMLATAFLLASFLCAAAPAQTAGADPARAATPTVTVTLTRRGVRLAALGGVKRVRLEVLASDGSVVSESGYRPGNFYDWAAENSALPDGAYRFAFTYVDATGRPGMRQCAFTLAGGEVALHLADEGGGDAALASGGVRESEQAPSGSYEPEAMTLTAHDGEEGRVVSTSGALSFRLGDFFTGRDVEVMRLTDEGITVAGLIKVGGGIRFDDGTVLTSTGRAGRINSDGTVSLSTSGTGTTNRVAKWVDNAGTLGDSALTESGGKVGIGTTNPAYGFHLVGGSLVVEGANGVNFGNADFAVKSASGNGFWDFAVTNSNGSFVMYDAVGQKLPFTVEQGAATNTLYVNSLGRVGIGTVSPSAKLHVEGDGLVNGVLTSAGLGVDTNTLWVDSTANNVGVGTTAPKHKLQVTGGNVYISTPGAGIILRSAQSNTCVLYTASESGLVGSSTPCP